MENAGLVGLGQGINGAGNREAGEADRIGDMDGEPIRGG